MTIGYVVTSRQGLQYGPLTLKIVNNGKQELCVYAHNMHNFGYIRLKLSRLLLYATPKRIYGDLANMLINDVTGRRQSGETAVHMKGLISRKLEVIFHCGLRQPIAHQ